jgi:AcrR family transcriptional regulator
VYLCIFAEGLAMRHRILDATERLLGRLGYQKTTVDDIAAEAGISRRTVYLHFRGKEDVALATIDRIVDRLIDRLEARAAETATWSSRLRAMLVERVLFRFDSVQGYFHSIDEIFRSLRAAYMARRARYFEREAEVFARVLAAGRATGEFSLKNPRAAADTLLLATNALLPSALSTRELGARSEVEARVAQIAELLLKGLGGPAASPAPRPRKYSKAPRRAASR